MIFTITNDSKSSWLMLDGEKFFPSTQSDIRALYARWLYPLHMDIAREIIEYLAQRMDHIKSNWMERGLEMSEWSRQEDAREYRALERNWTLLNTLYGSKHYV